jgi:hypothetical protein
MVRCLTMCDKVQFSGRGAHYKVHCIEPIAFFIIFELVVVNNLIRKTSIFYFFTLPYLFNAKLTFKRLCMECHNSLQKSCMDFFEIQNT